MDSRSTTKPELQRQRDQAVLVSLIQKALSFVPQAWATGLQARSPGSDVVHRTHIASAHRGAVCIYLERLLISLNPSACFDRHLESFVEEVAGHLDIFRPEDVLFPATAWPTFIVGAETNDEGRQKWVAGRFQELWEVEPWGMIRESLGVLERIWKSKKRQVTNDRDRNPQTSENTENDWITELKSSGVDRLIA